MKTKESLIMSVPSNYEYTPQYLKSRRLKQFTREELKSKSNSDIKKLAKRTMDIINRDDKSLRMIARQNYLNLWDAQGVKKNKHGKYPGEYEHPILFEKIDEYKRYSRDISKYNKSQLINYIVTMRETSRQEDFYSVEGSRQRLVTAFIGEREPPMRDLRVAELFTKISDIELIYLTDKGINLLTIYARTEVDEHYWYDYIVEALGYDPLE